MIDIVSNGAHGPVAAGANGHRALGIADADTR